MNMLGSTQKQYGVTPPISMTEPTKADQILTDSMIACLKDLGQYESEEEAQKREVVLGKINTLVKDFVKKVSLKKNLPESIANEAGGRIFTFGSYRLGVHGAGADIDTLCVVPVHVDREDFFTDMYAMLKERTEVTELTMVPDAYVPVINFSFSDIPIDLLFSRLNLPSISDDLDLSDNNLLKNLDERCVRSLNGSRVTDEILRLVPSVSAFRTALRCVKLWAKRRAIYSNIMGFFGGVAWAMIVARVCQLYPKALAGTVITKFFRIMQQWKWPQPVLLKPIEDGPLQVRVWNPRIYPQDKAHRMPIITPAYPSMCATHNVTCSTQKVMTREFKRAADLVDRIVVGQATWQDLFEKDDFFSSYKYYLQIVACSNSQENQLKWSGLVESKLRQLVMKLELIDNVEMAHPFIKSFEFQHVCVTEEETRDAKQGKFPPLHTVEESMEHELIWTNTFYIGIVVAPKDPKSTIPRKLDISWPISEFTKMVKMWDSFDETHMGVVVNFLKQSQLPVDVYGEEGPPSKEKLNKKRNKMEEDEDAKNKMTESLFEVVSTEKKMKFSDQKELQDTASLLSISNESVNSMITETTKIVFGDGIAVQSASLSPIRLGSDIEKTASVNQSLEDQSQNELSFGSVKVSPPRGGGIHIDLSKKSEIKLKLIN